MKFIIAFFVLLSSTRAMPLPDWSYNPISSIEEKLSSFGLPTLPPKPTLIPSATTNVAGLIPGTPTIFPKPDIAGLIPSLGGIPTMFPKPDIAGLIPSLGGIPTTFAQPDVAGLIPSLGGIPTMFPKPDVAGLIPSLGGIPTLFPKPDIAGLILSFPTFPKPTVSPSTLSTLPTLPPKPVVPTMFPKPQIPIVSDAINSAKTLLRNNPIRSIFKPQN